MDVLRSDEFSSFVSQFVEITTASIDTAKEFLQKTSGNLEVGFANLILLIIY